MGKKMFTVEKKFINNSDEGLLKNILDEIEVFENFLFEKKWCTTNSTVNWSLRIEDGCKCPILESNGFITVGIEFLKKTYMIAYYFVLFFAKKLANKDVLNKNIETIIYNKDEFFLWSVDERNWKKMECGVISKHIDYVFLYAIHFFINHEIGHTRHYGDGPDVENRCDEEAIDVLIEIIKKDIQRMNTAGSDYSVIDWKSFVGTDEEIVMRNISGAIIAQVSIAYFTRVNSYGESKEEKTDKEKKYPLSYERMDNFVKCFNRILKKRIPSISPKACNLIDDCFAYMFMGIVFLYEKFNFENVLECNVKYQTVCRQIFEILKVFSESDLENIFSKRRFCNDECIGLAEKIGNDWCFKRRSDYNNLFILAEDWKKYYRNSAYDDPIIFVLESPHKSEFFKYGLKIFDKDEKTYTRPARGQTKRYFDENIESVLNNLNLPSSNVKYHPIIIVNACRFQCSLGEKITTKKQTREKNFKKLFEGDNDSLNKKSLKARVEALHPYALINSCTKGYDEDYNLREHVGNVLSNCCCSYFRKTFHPASWRNPAFRGQRTIP